MEVVHHILITTLYQNWLRLYQIEGSICLIASKNDATGISLMLLWLRPHVPNAKGPGLIPAQGIRSHMSRLKIPRAAAKKPSTMQLRPRVAK